MERNILVEKCKSKGRDQIKGETGNHTTDISQQISAQPQETQRDTLPEPDGSLMMTTAEILDFSSGIDSTEYDEAEDR